MRHMIAASEPHFITNNMVPTGTSWRPSDSYCCADLSLHSPDRSRSGEELTAVVCRQELVAMRRASLSLAVVVCAATAFAAPAVRVNFDAQHHRQDQCPAHREPVLLRLPPGRPVQGRPRPHDPRDGGQSRQRPGDASSIARPTRPGFLVVSCSFSGNSTDARERLEQRTIRTSPASRTWTTRRK